MVDALVDAGMDAARLNLSHGTHDDHAARAELVRGAEEAAGRPLALIGDLQGPKLRVGELAAPLTLTAGDDVTVVIGEDGARDGELPIAPAAIGEVLRVRAAIDHVHHRHGQDVRRHAADPAEERDARM